MNDGLPAPEIVEPAEGDVVNAVRPRIRFRPPRGADESVVEVCRDRRCNRLVAWWGVKGARELVPDHDLPSGHLWLLVAARAGGRPLGTSAPRSFNIESHVATEGKYVDVIAPWEEQD